MQSALSQTQNVTKTVIETEGGVVASQNSLAARAGAEVLAAGGDAVDAAIATSFVIGVLEPWMSGPAGGGAMMLWRADSEEAVALNHGMRSPAALDPADYPLSGNGIAGDLFPWEEVTDNRNVQGATAIAVPGVVDGLGRAHARYGRMPWAELLAPAIQHAKQGMFVDWYAALIIASTTRELAKDSDAAAMFLEDGQWPMVGAWTSLAEKRLDQSRMADTLDQIARDGARALYDGDLGAAMAEDVQAKGGSLSHDDLRAYEATFSPALTFPFRDATLHAVPGLTAGPTLQRALNEAANTPVSGQGAPDGTDFTAIARGLKSAYKHRLAHMGEDGEIPSAEGCTTHFSVVDRAGNMVSQTQTLLSIFGSRVVSPSTGLLMNNGIMWFDPVQGRPNSLGPNKRCLMNVCPTLGETTSGTRFAIGASGGRKIVSAVANLAAFMTDHDMDVEEAFHHGRIDVSGGDLVIADEALPKETIATLSDTYDTRTAKRMVFPYAFACPAGVMRKNGRNSGCTEIMSPWGDAITEAEARK